MKSRTLITLLLISIAVTTATAQKAKHFEVGLQGGYGSHWIINQNNYGLPELDYQPMGGAGFNFQLGYNFTEEIGLFTEIGMTKQGQGYTDDNFTYPGLGLKDATVDRTVNLDYLNIPVFFKYSYGDSRARFRLMVGPQFCFLQKAEQEYLINEVDIAGQYSRTNKENESFDVGARDIEERFNSMDIAFVLDLGADIFVMENILYLSAGARLFYGLTDINASAYQMENYDGNYEASHNAGGTLYLGLHYIIAGKAE